MCQSPLEEYAANRTRQRLIDLSIFMIHAWLLIKTGYPCCRLATRMMGNSRKGFAAHKVLSSLHILLLSLVDLEV
jgi:hypothetical protein